jgi:nucleotide-binding universal stress UspA family protein
MWETPADGPTYAGYVPPDPAEKEFARQAAARSLSEALAGLGADFPGLEIQPRPIHGPTLEGLVEVSREASLLVVARHRTPHVASLGLGHVARKLLTDAHCPVMVTPIGTVGRWQQLLHTPMPASHNY